MRWRKFAAVLICLAGAATPGAAENMISRFFGKWLGEGHVRVNGFDQPDKIRCKVEGLKMTEAQISFAGRCATVNGAGAFSLLIAQEETGQVFAGKVLFSTGNAAVDFGGTRSIDGITLTQKKPVERGGRLLTSVITLAFPDDRVIDFVNTMTDLNTGETAESLVVLFKRQD